MAKLKYVICLLQRNETFHTISWNGQADRLKNEGGALCFDIFFYSKVYMIMLVLPH